MPAVTDLQFDGRLSNIAVQYANPEYIGDLVIPPTSVPQIQGKFKKYDKDERFTVPSTLVGPKGLPNEVEWNVSEDTFLCAPYALSDFVSQMEIDNAESPIQPMADSTEFTMGLMLLAKEKRIADFVFDATNYAAANQFDVAGGWNTLTDDALTDIEAGIDACFMPPNVMVMGLPTWRKLSRNEKILAAVKGTLAPQAIKGGKGVAQPAINIAELAEYFGLDAVLVGRARINTAKPGQAASYSRVWDGTNATKGGAALLRVRKNGALKDVVSAANFDWRGRQVLTSPSQRGAYGSREVRVVETNVLKSISTDVGYLFKDALGT